MQIRIRAASHHPMARRHLGGGNGDEIMAFQRLSAASIPRCQSSVANGPRATVSRQSPLSQSPGEQGNKMTLRLQRSRGFNRRKRRRFAVKAPSPGTREESVASRHWVLTAAVSVRYTRSKVKRMPRSATRVGFYNVFSNK
ncbi:hypothetical protein SKAU_G00257910 [Synaphobranchus kaupii]|uniref:Uncharacterized protein n=1 Tax=Synaphobranchus kaupii TaxID=118154 RepID=A0A9Q1IRM0_SYNKA|nr:hypothetical protein SKAU_G00257910 [Synaphobranchus kaupii]